MFGDGGPAVDVPDAGMVAAGQVRIDPSRGYQTLEGVGANVYAYPFVNDEGWIWDQVKFVFDELDIRYVRLSSWFTWWETNNDNDDPYTINWSGFGTVMDVVRNEDVPLAQFLHARNIEVMFGVWNAADWLAHGTPRRIDPTMYPELGESVAAYLLNMRDKGMVPQRFVEMANEPDIGTDIQYPTPESLRDAALAVVDQLDHFGVGEVMLHGPSSSQPKYAGPWAAVWFANDKLRARTAALSYHTWWSDRFSEYDAIRRAADMYQKPVWATEIGYCALQDGCFKNTHFLKPELWSTAFDYAESYYRAIAWTHAVRLYHWSLLGDGACVSPTGERLPSFYVLKHFANTISPGTKLVDAASGDADVHALAFLRPDGGLAVVLINRAADGKIVELVSAGGRSLGSMSGTSSSDGQYEQAVQVVPAASGGIQVTLPAGSVTSLRL